MLFLNNSRTRHGPFQNPRTPSFGLLGRKYYKREGDPSVCRVVYMYFCLGHQPVQRKVLYTSPDRSDSFRSNFNFVSVPRLSRPVPRRSPPRRALSLPGPFRDSTRTRTARDPCHSSGHPDFTSLPLLSSRSFPASLAPLRRPYLPLQHVRPSVIVGHR